MYRAEQSNLRPYSFVSLPPLLLLLLLLPPSTMKTKCALCMRVFVCAFMRHIVLCNLPSELVHTIPSTCWYLFLSLALSLRFFAVGFATFSFSMHFVQTPKTCVMRIKIHTHTMCECVCVNACAVHPFQAHAFEQWDGNTAKKLQCSIPHAHLTFAPLLHCNRNKRFRCTISGFGYTTYAIRIVI